MRSRRHRPRKRAVVGGLAGLAVTAAAVVYAVRPDHTPAGAGQIVGYTPGPTPTASAGAPFPRSGKTLFADDFKSAADGPLDGRQPSTGPTWTVSGIQPPTITGGAAGSTGTGYAGARLARRPVTVSGTVRWEGKPGGQMTLIMSADDGILIRNAVHLNFGPAGFALTLRRDAGRFAPLLAGSWSRAMPDGTAETVALAVKGDRVWVRGPSGETFTATSPTVPKVAGREVIWEPNRGAAGRALLLAAAATG